MALRRKQDTQFYFQPRQGEYAGQETIHVAPREDLAYPREYDDASYGEETRAFAPQEAFDPQETYDPMDAYEEGAYDQEPYDESAYEAYPPEDYYDEYPPEDLDLLDEEAYQEEKKLRRLGRFRVAAGVLDFFGVIGGMVAVLLLAALLISLINWLHADILRTFTILQTRL